MTTYVMPSTREERARLVAEMTSWCAEVLRSPTRQPNIANWMTMGMSELRAMHGRWQMLIVAVRAKRANAARKESPARAENERLFR